MAMAMAMHRRTAMKLFIFLALISLINAAAQETSYKGRRYAVVFDAGSTGSRVHVYCFGDNMELIPINGVGIEFAKKVKPGLSAYADNPEEAANSLKELLQSAVEVVPEAARPVTPVRLGATAGLRQISEVKADKILAAVRKLFSHNTTFKFEEGWVSLLEGNQEGAFMWVR
uniref:Apyrase n=1 Tax=Picea sitchensis TaxID=3332 RepID=A9P214_PICSI|nr:unknown [Picea sitchensis]